MGGGGATWLGLLVTSYAEMLGHGAVFAHKNLVGNGTK